MRTHNDSTNAAMLAVNRKLGYQPLSGTLHALRWLRVRAAEAHRAPCPASAVRHIVPPRRVISLTDQPGSA
jgi:hypothetical protein